jgi:ribosome biogenesis SPOUT family RNA methylase Rps3
MRTLAGPDAHVFFTHLSEPSTEPLSAVFQNSNDNSIAKTSCHTIGVVELINQHSDILSKEQVCLLDPKAEKGLTPDDGDGRFRWFLFGVS